MKPEDAELQILLSEKQHADRQVGSYLELQLKLVAFLLGAGSAGLGFVFARGQARLQPKEAAVVILVVCVAGCVVMMQSVITYGIALGYIHYKKLILAPRLQALCKLPVPLAFSVNSFSSSPARYPVFIAAALLALLHAVATSALLVYASWFFRRSPETVTAFMGCWVLLAVTLVSEMVLGWAMRKVGK